MHAVSPERQHLEITFPRVAGYKYQISAELLLTPALQILADSGSDLGDEVPRYEARRGPGRTRDVNFWTSRPVQEARRCHLNYVVLDTATWEQSAACYLDVDDHVIAFVNNANLGLAIPYRRHAQSREYVPEFLARLRVGDREVGTLILETKGFDPLTHIKVAAAQRWVAAVNTDGSHGRWAYRIVTAPAGVPAAIRSAARELSEPARPGWRVALDRFVAEAKNAYGPRIESVVLYGSRARGDAEPSSDVDVLVVFAPGEEARGERQRLGEIAACVSAEHDCLISVLCAAADEFRTGARPVVANARAEGTIVA